MPITLTVLILFGALGLFMIWEFNSLVRHRNQVKEAWSGIDVQLKRRHDLVPSLVDVVEGYASHEKGLFEEVTRLRNESIKVVGLKDTQAAEK